MDYGTKNVKCFYSNGHLVYLEPLFVAIFATIFMSVGMHNNNSTTNDVMHVCGSIILFIYKSCKKIEKINCLILFIEFRLEISTQSWCNLGIACELKLLVRWCHFWPLNHHFSLMLLIKCSFLCLTYVLQNYNSSKIMSWPWIGHASCCKVWLWSFYAYTIHCLQDFSAIFCHCWLCHI